MTAETVSTAATVIMAIASMVVIATCVWSLLALGPNGQIVFWGILFHGSLKS